MSKKKRNETEEERKERKRVKKEAKKKKKKRKSIESAASVSVPKHPQTPALDSFPSSHDPLELTAFHQKRLNLVVSLFPVDLGNVMSHVRESLRSMLLKYSDGIGGVLLGFDNVTLANDENYGMGVILNEFPYVHYSVELDALVFAPQVGSRLTGVVNESFPSHVGLLVYSFFNAMVSSDNLRSAGYLYDRDVDEWKQESGSKVLAANDQIEIAVEKIHECEGVISMEGSIMKEQVT